MLRVGPELDDARPEQLEMTELRDGHVSQIRLVGQRDSERGIVGKPEEGHERRVGQQPEQFDHAVCGQFGTVCHLVRVACSAGRRRRLAHVIGRALMLAHIRQRNNAGPR
jgi:hypothetical protein